MNAWLVAAGVLLVSLAFCGLLCLRGSPIDRLVGLELAGSVDALILLLLAEGFHRAIYFDLAVCVALLTFAGGLVFTHFMERWV